MSRRHEAGDLTVGEIAETLHQRAYRVLRRAILQLHLLPGQFLSEREVAEALGISRTPAREAVWLLRQEGLVATQGRRGLQVTPLHPEAIDQAYVVRESLEVLSVRMACEAAGENDIRAMRQLIEEAESPSRRDEVDAFVADANAVHMRIAQATGNAVLVETLGGVLDRIERVRWLDVTDEQRRASSLRDHRRLVELTAAGDADQAAILMAHHVQVARESIHHRLQHFSNLHGLSLAGGEAHRDLWTLLQRWWHDEQDEGSTG